MSYNYWYYIIYILQVCNILSLEANVILVLFPRRTHGRELCWIICDISKIASGILEGTMQSQKTHKHQKQLNNWLSIISKVACLTHGITRLYGVLAWHVHDTILKKIFCGTVSFFILFKWCEVIFLWWTGGWAHGSNPACWLPHVGKNVKTSYTTFTVERTTTIVCHTWLDIRW